MLREYITAARQLGYSEEVEKQLRNVPKTKDASKYEAALNRVMRKARLGVLA